MKKLSITKGFGVATAIIIIAILSIGGYTAVRYSQKNKVEMEMKKADSVILAESKTKIKVGLENLQKTLASNIGLDAKVQATTEIITDLKAGIATAQDSLSTEASAQLEVIDDKLTQLAVEIKLNTETAVGTLGDLIKSIEISLETEGESEMNSDIVDQNQDEMLEDENNILEINDTATTSVEVDIDTELELSN